GAARVLLRMLPRAGEPGDARRRNRLARARVGTAPREHEAARVDVDQHRLHVRQHELRSGRGAHAPLRAAELPQRRPLHARAGAPLRRRHGGEPDVALRLAAGPRRARAHHGGDQGARGGREQLGRIASGMQIPLAPVWPGHGPPLMRKTESASRPARWRLAVALLAILAASATATIGAMRHTSTTFDEVSTIAAGARGFMTGRFDVVDDHPPLMQYLYGLPVYLTHPSFPPERAGGRRPNRYTYAADFFGRSGND